MIIIHLVVQMIRIQYCFLYEIKKQSSMFGLEIVEKTVFSIGQIACTQGEI